MAKRRNSPALFELLRDPSGVASEAGVQSAPRVERTAIAEPKASPVRVEPMRPGPAPVPTPAPEPTREAKPLSTEPTMEITSPRFVAEPVRVRPGEPDVPDLSGLEPEPAVTRSEDGRIAFSLTPAMLAGISGAAIVLLVVVTTIAYSLGGAASEQQLQPILGEQANQALGSTSQPTVREPEVREPASRPASGPQSSRDPVPRAGVTLTPESTEQTPAVDDRALAEAEAETPPAANPEPAPSGPTNVDTRQPGLNYLYTSVTFDRDEVERAQQFLFDNGVDSIIEEGTRRSDGRTVYRLWTLVGIPGDVFSTSREKFNHQRAMFDLGNEWLTEHGGKLDFSRESQIAWQKFGD